MGKSICLPISLIIFLAPTFVAFSNVDKTATVSGKVTTYFGDPLEGAQVKFFLLNGEKGMGIDPGTEVKAVETDSNGIYKSKGLPAGEYRVTSALQGFPVSEISRYYVTPGENRILNFGLSIGITHGLEPIRISGVITGENGKAIPGATVTILSAYDSSKQMQTSADSSGRYEFVFIQPGHYVIFVNAHKFLSGSTTLLADNRMGRRVRTKVDLRLKPFNTE